MRRALLLAAAVLACALAAHHPEAGAGSGSLFLYVHDDSDTDQVFGFRFNPDGTLAPLPNSPFATGNVDTGCGGPCETIAFSAKKRLLVVGGENGITAFRVASNGQADTGARLALRRRQTDRGRGGAGGDEGLRLRCGVRRDRVRAFRAKPDGSLVPLLPPTFPTGDQPVGMSAAKDLLFVANQDDGTISTYKVQGNGSLVEAPGSPFTVGTGDTFSVSADPKGKFVYVPDCETNQVSGFLVNQTNAALTPVAGSPFTIGPDNACGGLAVSKKAVLFALGDIAGGADDVQAIRRNNATGVLTNLGGAQNSGVSEISTAGLDPTGRFLVVAAPDPTDQVQSFSVNLNTGAISHLDTEAADFGIDVTGLVFARP